MPKEHPKEWVRTWIEIDKRSLFFNLRYFRKLAGGALLMAMIKSNAYGHGLALIARLLQHSDVWFGVDSITEAVRLREEKIKSPVLVLGYTLPRRLAEAEEKNIIVTVSHFEGLQELARMKKKPRFHIKIDTGMHRQGFQEKDILKLIQKLKRHRLKPEGIYSHFSMPSNKEFSGRQIALFKKVVSIFNASGIAFRYVHLNKTEGIVRFQKSAYSLARLGIGLYGYYPGKGPRIRPILSWKTIVGEVKDVKKGEYISYDLTERLKRDSKIAILPLGYWHGLDRGLSSIGEVLIGGARARILGRVTMDMTIVDVTDILRVRVGDEVVIIGRQGKERITADDMAKKINTTSYEVLTRINPLIRKVIV
jgi:alanine racemase